VGRPRRTSPSAVIRAAQVEESEALAALACRSKAYWGYSEGFIEACRAELSVSPECIRRGDVFVLTAGATLIGFYTLEARSPERVELGHMFVEPGHIGRGFGRMLVEHVQATARRRGFASLVVQADPNAAPFYEAVGARRVGTRPSASITSRSLPVLELTVEAT
jgi:GNAT superfamily N-acetyltransferase